MSDKPLLTQSIAKLTRARGVAMALGAVIVLTGILAIFLGIHDEGFIDIKSAVISGRIRTGHVGLLLLFLGIVLTTLVLSVPATAKHRIEVTSGRRRIVYTGRLSMEAYQIFLRLVRNLEGKNIDPPVK